MLVETLTKKIAISTPAYQLFSLLTNNGQLQNSALLETAEAATHQHKKSMIMLSAALKIACTDQQVSLEALNDNGQAILDYLQQLERFKELAEIKSLAKNKLLLNLTVTDSSNLVDEKQRLMARSSFDVLRLIATELKDSDNSDNNFFIGTISFDAIDQFEQLPSVDKDVDDYSFFIADQLIIQRQDNYSCQIISKGFANYASNKVHLSLNINHIEEKLKSFSQLSRSEIENEISSNNFSVFSPDNELNTQSKVSVNISDELFAKKVDKVKQHITEGDVFQAVISRDFTVDCPDPYTAYVYLRHSNPSPYMYYFNHQDYILFGASPESCLKVNSDKQLQLYPIAGTRKRPFASSRGVDANINYEKEAKVEFELLNDIKEGAEHMMLVDLARNDIAKVCKAKSRSINQLKQVVKYSNLMHLVSEVKGNLCTEYDAFHAYTACANMGTLTGAPKIRASEIIRQQEAKSRGLYGGAVCLFNSLLEFDSAIIIRSAVVKNGRAKITAGAGIVYDSVPLEEAKETRIKAQSVLDACIHSSKKKLSRDRSLL